MPIVVNSVRGRYLLALAAPAEALGDALALTLALERADGVERIAMRCRIDRALVNAAEPEVIVARLAPWIERDFESVRETALKTIRTERRLHEFSFDAAHRGPF